MDLSKLKIAIVHDVIDTYGGAERVVETLLEAFPDADLYTSRATNNPQTKVLRKRLTGTTFMQKLPWIPILNKVYTPLYPLAFESLNLRSYDVVISSTAHFAKGVLTTPEQLHVCYCHTPPRFLYGYPSESGIRNFALGRFLLSSLDHNLLEYDYLCAQRPDIFIANSQTVAKRIQKFYNRRSVVMYPPVVDRYNSIDSEIPKHNEGKYFLTVSRLVSYKNVDTIVRAFNSRSDKLIVVGDGPELAALQKIAHQNIEFKTFVSEIELSKLYTQAQAFIFAASDEDFGITPVEAMSAGIPVIALRSGGVSETVTDDTGVFFDENTVGSLSVALQKFAENEEKFSREVIVRNAQRFSKDLFISQIRAEIESAFTKISSP